jgi:membrane protein YqaA with SNARE-associated domain
MLDYLLQYGLLSLLIISFLASTLLPLGSEWFLVLLLLKGTSPLWAVATATLGNSLGAWTNYLIGVWGQEWVIRRVLRIDPTQQQRAQNWFRHYGSWSLLLSWLPLVGDPLCLISGIMKTPQLRFFLLVVSGKGLRYLALALATLGAVSL